MSRQPKSKLSLAITAALELPDEHPMCEQAKSQVTAAALSAKTDKEARESLGGVAAGTWVRWKRRVGLEVKLTNPGGHHV